MMGGILPRPARAIITPTPVDAPVPHTEVGDIEPEDLYGDGNLDCPVCMSFMRDSVYQCLDGHLTCEACYARVTTSPKRCPSCRSAYPALMIRNRAIEFIAQQAQTLGLVGRRNPPPTLRNPNLARRDDVRDTVAANPGIALGLTSPQQTLRLCRHCVTCNGPQCISEGRGEIVGVRYTCAECHPSVDFCHRCVRDGLHGHHLLVRIFYPNQSRKVDLAKRLWSDWRNRPQELQGGSGDGPPVQQETDGRATDVEMEVTADPMETGAPTSTPMGTPATSRINGQRRDAGGDAGAGGDTGRRTTQAETDEDSGSGSDEDGDDEQFSDETGSNGDEDADGDGVDIDHQ